MCTVLYYCHRVSTKLQLTNISISITWHYIDLSVSRVGRFTPPGKRTPATENWRLGGLQSCAGRFAEGKNSLFLHGKEPRFFGRPPPGVMTIPLIKSWKQEYKCQGTRFHILAQSLLQWVNVKLQAVK